MNSQRWIHLMNHFGFDDNTDTYLALEKSYNETHRHYHNASHIKAVLHHFDETKHLAMAPKELELALWFHDAIYKPLSSSNELDSANWASEFLKGNKANEETINRVFQLIMVTLHNGIPNDNDEKLVVDIDLAILGSPKEIYDQFEKNVRQEYKFVPKIIYKKKRKEILESFLARDRIYSHDYFYENLEQNARNNIENTIQSM